MSNKPPTVDQALVEARSLARNGEPDRARRVYRAVLEKFPGNQRAIEGLNSLKRPKPIQGQTVFNSGPTQEQINGLIALYNQRRLQEALAQGTALAERYPDMPLILNILGAVNADTGRLDEAVAVYSRALRLKPGYAEAHNNLGNALKALGKPEQAIASYTEALRLKPGYAEAHNNLGNVLSDLGKSGEAVASLTEALRLRPDFAEAHYNLGNVLNALGKHEEAAASLTEALRLRPGYADAHNNLGNVLMALGSHEDAVASLNNALRIKPDFAEAHCNLGNVLMALGKQEEAIASYSGALRIKPGYAEARRSLGTMRNYETGDPQVARMLEQIASPAITENDKMHLSFALGKAYDDIGESEVSFQHLLEGNRLRKKELGYDIDSAKKQFSRIKSIFEAGSLPTLEETQPDAGPTKRPIFIVGMPRSGTTLIEQILASHSQVHGAGELKVLGRVVAPLLADVQQVHAGQLTVDTVEIVRGAYLSALDGLGDDEGCITDKMPLNFRWIGFILTAMPEAKVINLQRDPVATCWSVFKHYFSSKGNGYAFDLVDVAEYYKLYIDLMDFWREGFPNRIYDLDYEALTEHQEAETRKLLGYCDLDWEDQCLEFHKTIRGINTASSNQVRQAMYKGSSEAWRKYETHIQPMLQALKG